MPRRSAGRTTLVSLLLLVFVSIAILFPALAGAVTARPLEAAGIFSDRIVICTGSGLQVIWLDSQGTPLPEQEEQYNIAPALCAPVATAALAEFRDGLFIQLPRPPLPDLPRPAAALHLPSHGTEYPPALTRGPPGHV